MNILTFQSTLPREERQSYLILIILNQKFQSTLPREERRVAHVLGALGVYRFQSTLPREERPLGRFSVTLFLHFNPRSHERSDGEPFLVSHHPLISIHAPTRGATVNVPPSTLSPLIFNPRSHERSDDLTATDNSGNNYISIHAPTRGATPGYAFLRLSSRFQSTLPREERPVSVWYLNLRQVFQSTLPREERLLAWILSSALQYFNPRSHERSD